MIFNIRSVSFLVACKRLYKRVRRSVRRSVGHAFVKISFSRNFVDFWALLPLPKRTRLMAVYPALLSFFLSGCVLTIIQEKFYTYPVFVWPHPYHNSKCFCAIVFFFFLFFASSCLTHQSIFFSSSLGKKSKLLQFFETWDRNPVFRFSLEKVCESLGKSGAEWYLGWNW